MKFDLKAHLENHAFYFKEYREIKEQDLHFNFSFLSLDFIGRDPKKVMMELLKDLRVPVKYREPNGSQKSGKKAYANRVMDLEKTVKIEAIHFEDPEGNDTEPHIHFMLEKKGRYGLNFSLLKKHISIISEKHELTPNFDEMTEHNPFAVKNMSKATKSLSWSWKKMKNEELRKSIETRGLDKAVKLLSDYALKTNSLSYYIKTMEGLKKRLNRLKLDVELDGHNLRDTYPIPLTEKDLEVVKLINEKRFNQKDIKPHLKNPIFRDFIRHSSGISKPFIISALKEQTSLLEGVYKNKRAVENYMKLSKKTPVVKKSRLTKTDNKALSIKSDLGRNLKLAAQSACNEKELRALMQDAGYEGFGFKKQKGSIKGCFYLENEKKKTFKFIDISVNWSRIKKQLMENTRNRDNGQEIEKKEVHKRDLKPFEDLTQPLPLTKMPKPVELEYKSEEVAKTKEIAKEKSRVRRLANELVRKFENGIRGIKNKIRGIIAEIKKVEAETIRVEAKLENPNGNDREIREKIKQGDEEHKHLEVKIESIEARLGTFRGLRESDLVRGIRELKIRISETTADIEAEEVLEQFREKREGLKTLLKQDDHNNEIPKPKPKP